MYRGCASFDQSVDSTRLPAHLADRLRLVQARNVQVEGYRVTFTGGMFRLVNNWNVLVPFGFGELTVDPERHEIQYAVSFRQLVLMSLR